MSKQSSLSGKIMYQKTIPLVLMSVIALAIIFDFYVPKTILANSVKELSQWGNICAQWVLLYSYVFLFIVHFRRVTSPKEKARMYQRPLSVIFLLTFVLFLVYALTLPGMNNHPNYTVVYSYIIGYASAGVYYVWVTMGYQCYQFLRLSSIEGAAFVITWFFTMTKETPVFTFLNKPFFADIGYWFESFPAMAAQRGMVIAAAVGIILIIIRTIMLREPGVLGMSGE